jgi:glycogen synthase
MVTPEIAFLPQGMGPGTGSIAARAGGLGDICAAQFRALSEQGVDVHLAMPDYRNVFKRNAQRRIGIDLGCGPCQLPGNRIHLAQDRNFFYHPRLVVRMDEDNIRMALAFQREVMNHIIPSVRPDLIHCYDWMTGLVPAMARLNDIPCLFTLYRLNSPRLLLATIEERGIDAALFWQDCYYARMPINYEETRSTNPVDLLTSGVFAAHTAIVLNETFVKALRDEDLPHAPAGLRRELHNKFQAGRLLSAVPSLDPSFNPARDRHLVRPYGPESHGAGKMVNKLHLQESLSLRMDSTAPVFFWPTRLDSERPGCGMMAATLADILARYRDQRLQIVFVADGDFQAHMQTLIGRLKARDRAAVCDFDDQRYRRAYAGSDFVLMPLQHDPCSLPCMIGQRYGTLPIAFDTGVIHDCVAHLDAAAGVGSGFLFENFDAGGFLWAIDQAMAFYRQAPAFRASLVQRIMADSLTRFDPENIVRQTIDLYAHVLDQPLVEHRVPFSLQTSPHLAA